MTIQIRPDRATAEGLAREYDVVPIVLDLPAHDLTPVTVMQRLGVEGDCFLLESAGAGGRVAGFSLMGHAPAEVRAGGDADPLSAFEEVLAERVAPVDDLDVPFTGGWVGYLGYEAARWYERLPDVATPFPGVPESVFGLYRTVVVVDHGRGLVRLITQLRAETPGGYEAAAAELDALRVRIAQPCASAAVDAPSAIAVAPGTSPRAAPRTVLTDDSSTFPRAAFLAAVERALAHVRAGDVYQVQVSRRFTVPLRAHPFTLYTALREQSPTPYLFYVRSAGCTLVGASPETLVAVRGGEVTYRPIAGTRRRGADAAEDAAMEHELRGSTKEQAEHLMLVDLGRNDVGRVAAVGSVRVVDGPVVERYARVMHLVSTIRARLDAGRTALDALRSCFPAGTVTGAPKIRAMEVIADLEPHGRGPYAGAVGYIGSGGALDTAIALRTVVVVDGTAHLQAAAGIVAGSSPEEEAREIDNKLAAAVDALLRTEQR